MGPRHTKIKTPSNPLEEMQMKQKRKLKREQERKKQEEYIKKAREKALKEAKKKKSQKSSDQQDDSKTEQQALDLKNEEYNEIAVTKLREQLSSDIPAFISNQLVLSVQFFGNFEVEKNAAIQYFNKKEYELNQKLENHSVILVNAIDDAVDKRVQFQAKHGPEKHITFPLQLQTLYLVYENVQVYDPNYAHIQPVCQVDMDLSDFVGEDKILNGFIRLKLRDGNKSNSRTNLSNNIVRQRLLNYAPSATSSADSLYESESHTEQTYNSSLRQSPLVLNRQEHEYNHESSDATSAYVSSSETDYEYVTNLNTHQPLTVNETQTTISSILPESCISTVKLENGSDSDSESENDNLEVKYINSKRFFSYFMELLKNRLARDLDINEGELSSATWKGASIFTTKYEIIPAIHIPNWPGCAIEWRTRPRSKYRNPVTGRYVQWPTPEMIKEVLDYGCHVIPQGYVHKTQHNPNRGLEWKIIFPKAEKYLESCLTSTQIKILMICKALIKTFIETQEKRGTYMFTIDHLRTHLFWECEKNFLAWNDEFLGETLIRFLKSFIRRLSKKSLPDYFIRDRNLFESIPDRYKNALLMILSQIVENPVTHLLKTLRNLRQIEQFHPKFNYNKLYTCIVTDNLIKFIRQIRSCVKSNQMLDAIEEENNNAKDNIGNSDNENSTTENEPEGLIAYYNKKEKLDETKRRRTKKLKMREVQRLKKQLEREMENRPSEDSIDIQFIVPENLDSIPRYMKKGTENVRPILDQMRCVLIIEFFINHFIEMSKSMHKFKSFDQVNIYLNQAERLAQILSDFDYKNYADNYISDIQRIRNSIKDVKLRSLEAHQVPELPLRTSLQPVESFRKNPTIQRQNSRVKFIEPRPFQFEVDNSTPTSSPKSRPSSIKFIEPIQFQPDIQNLPTSTPSPGCRPNSVKFQFQVDVHTPSPTPKPRPLSGILKDSKSKFDSSFDTVRNVEIRNPRVQRDRVKTRSITLVKDNEDDIAEISESTEL